MNIWQGRSPSSTEKYDLPFLVTSWYVTYLGPVNIMVQTWVLFLLVVLCDILPCHVSMDNWYFMSFPFNYFGIMKIGPEMELGRII